VDLARKKTREKQGEPMRNPLMAAWRKTFPFLEKNSILVAAFVIYSYYLLTSIDIITHPGQKAGLINYIFQFDTLIVLWILAAVVVQLQKYRRKLKEEEDFKKSIIQEHEREKVQLRLLDEITRDLNDTINNPLAIISVSTDSLRDKFSSDKEVADYLDRIETAMKRIREVIGDFKVYQTKKIVQSNPSYLPETRTGTSSMNLNNDNLLAKAKS
jgi:signal transduction histidine kinase